MENLALV